MTQKMTHIPDSLFESEQGLSHVCRSLGMWLHYLCKDAPERTVSMTLKELEGYVVHDLIPGDLYRLQRAGYITIRLEDETDDYEARHYGKWSITLVTDNEPVSGE